MKSCTQVWSFVPRCEVLYPGMSFWNLVRSFASKYEVLHPGINFCTQVWSVVQRYDVLYPGNVFKIFSELDIKFIVQVFFSFNSMYQRIWSEMHKNKIVFTLFTLILCINRFTDNIMNNIFVTIVDTVSGFNDPLNQVYCSSKCNVFIHTNL
jgi:hypothetical protein